nr:hypothetical protein [Tanacetum cinerariifolium]
GVCFEAAEAAGVFVLKLPKQQGCLV